MILVKGYPKPQKRIDIECRKIRNVTECERRTELNLESRERPLQRSDKRGKEMDRAERVKTS